MSARRRSWAVSVNQAAGRPDGEPDPRREGADPEEEPEPVPAGDETDDGAEPPAADRAAP
ncbi:hypothetical protein ABTX81_22920 [Kitasatospora sp. NPDC097605]|uniref:hypothetical protein n=1 Tax=Kitasatospora sp. NPDC097605 TaxID=3157226 RepID=UPI0033265261